MNLLSKLLAKNKKIKIDFCEKNLDRFVSDEDFSNYQTFLEQKNVLYKEYNCQSKCKECKNSPYAIVNGEFVAAKNSEELLIKLEQLSKNK